MLSEWFLNRIWACVGLWALLTISDYALTIAGARLLQRGAGKHFVFSKYELEPSYQAAVSKAQLFSFELILQLFLWGGLLAITYYDRRRIVFSLLWGGLIFVELAVHLRHLRNVLLFRFASVSNGIKGQIEYAHWLSLRMSSWDMFLFAGLFFLTYLFTDDLLVLGGGGACFLVGIRHAMLAKRAAAQDLS